MRGGIAGDPTVFAIEWTITEAYQSKSQLALGFFIIWVDGKAFGARSPTATLLGCSYYEVKERILRRGFHLASFMHEPAIQIAVATRGAIYNDQKQDKKYFGLSVYAFTSTIVSSKILWAPDGDAAFDDGGHVLQFDSAETVRLVAFDNCANTESFEGTVAEVTLESEKFYEVLESWIAAFEIERAQALQNGSKH
jgi:Immunity protein 42